MRKSITLVASIIQYYLYIYQHRRFLQILLRRSITLVAPIIQQYLSIYISASQNSRDSHEKIYNASCFYYIVVSLYIYQHREISTYSQTKIYIASCCYYIIESISASILYRDSPAKLYNDICVYAIVVSLYISASKISRDSVEKIYSARCFYYIVVSISVSRDAQRFSNENIYRQLLLLYRRIYISIYDIQRFSSEII